MNPDRVPMWITKRAYGLKGISQNMYAMVYADAYDLIRDEIRREAAEEIRSLRDSCHYDVESPEYRHMSGCASLVDPEVQS